jgi:hypothetical protein
MKIAYRILFGICEEKRCSESYRRMILKLVLKKLGVRVWTVFIWLRTGTVGGLL